MLPPNGHDVNPRCCCSPLLMLSACLDDAASLFLPTVVERCHGRLFDRCRTGGALGHGTGPWDDVTEQFVSLLDRCDNKDLLPESTELTAVARGVVKRAIVDDFSENFVDVDMNARLQAVDEWMVRRENQSMYWEQPIDAFQASMRIQYRRSNRVTQEVA